MNAFIDDRPVDLNPARVLYARDAGMLDDVPIVELVLDNGTTATTLRETWLAATAPPPVPFGRFGHIIARRERAAQIAGRRSFLRPR